MCIQNIQFKFTEWERERDKRDQSRMLCPNREKSPNRAEEDCIQSGLLSLCYAFIFHRYTPHDFALSFPILGYPNNTDECQ
jgi:hypothetical protein